MPYPCKACAVGRVVLWGLAIFAFSLLGTGVVVFLMLARDIWKEGW